MKLNKYPQPAKTALAPPAPNAGQMAMDLMPCPDAVAREAYFAYVNEGSPQGRDVQHWLHAEARLISERNRTRVHGFHNPT